MSWCLQVREDAPGPLVKWYRHISKGAWPFSTRDHGWPISDCSSEGLKVQAWCQRPAAAVALCVDETPCSACVVPTGAFGIGMAVHTDKRP